MNLVKLVCKSIDKFTNNFVHIKDGDFYVVSFFHDDKELLLNNKDITKIISINCPNLVLLDLSKNNIRKIEGIDQLINLKRLNLHHNSISKIENIHDISEINIAYNLIDTMENIPKVENLCLSHNKIASINNTNNSIKALDLSYNSISKIENIPKKIIYLDLCNNKINKIENLYELESLTKVFLGNNAIETFDYDSINSHYIEIVDLRFNKITDIGDFTKFDDKFYWDKEHKIPIVRGSSERYFIKVYLYGNKIEKDIKKYSKVKFFLNDDQGYLE